MKEEVKFEFGAEEVTRDVKFVTFTLALGPGAPKNSVALLEAEESYKEKYLDYEIKMSQIVASTDTHVQIFMVLVK